MSSLSSSSSTAAAQRDNNSKRPSSNGTNRPPRRSLETARADGLKSFERKLAEADGYLQLLIAQVRDVERKIEATGTSDAEKAKLLDIKAKTLLLLDKVKLTIVSLQIAKNTVVPEDETRNLAPLQVRTSNNSSNTKRHLSPTSADSAATATAAVGNVNNSSSNDSKSVNDDDGSSADFVVEPDKFNPRTSSLRRADHNSHSYDLAAEALPPGTYSSDSDDDDDYFYDANEDTLSLSPTKLPADATTASSLSPTAINNTMSVDKLYSAGGVDYDTLYDEEEVELDSLDGQGSVISHLLSQVKIGMDLTKVVLPTFILERRSLLEMYADFFAHPDLFVSIADAETPEDRIVAVVRWYLSAFHAGRKSSVAKKPYNPVLGETFHCYWDVPNYASPCTQESDQTVNRKLVSDGPIPWCLPSNLAFSAEQVSHHPPISAFYCEHIEKRIMFSGYIYTKSAFLGLSIGVHHIGQGSVYLLDKGEEYTVTFPSAYGRSILTVPWIELGGNVIINCAQTGYSAAIEFLTKPFYGGKKHRISGEILNPNKKPIMTITGEWNGVMNAKWIQNGRTEVFVDTKAVPIIRKQVQPIAKQDDFESRRMWKDVTLALKMKDVTAATEAKFKIEQNQRDLVKKRQQDGVAWETRKFHSLGNRWNYNSPLTQRYSNRTYQ